MPTVLRLFTSVHWGWWFALVVVAGLTFFLICLPAMARGFREALDFCDDLGRERN